MKKLSFKEYVKEHEYSDRLDEERKQIQIYYIEEEKIYIIKITLGIGLVLIEYYPEWNSKAPEIKDRIVKETYPTKNGFDMFQVMFVVTSNQEHVMDVIETSTLLGDEGVSLHDENGFIRLLPTKEYLRYRLNHIHLNPGKCQYQFLQKNKTIPVNWVLYGYGLPEQDRIGSMIHSYLTLLYNAVECFYRENYGYVIPKYQTEEYFYRKLTLETTVRNAGIHCVDLITSMIMEYFYSVTVPANYIRYSPKRRKTNKP